MSKKRLRATIDGTIWQKVTKGQDGIKWDSVVENVWAEIGVNQDEIMSPYANVGGTRQN